MLYKISYEGQNKIIKLKQNQGISELQSQIPKYFPSLFYFQLYYLDEDQDQISLTIQEDFDIFKEKKKSNLKIYLRKKDNSTSLSNEKKAQEIQHSRRSQQTSFSHRIQSRIINQYSSQHRDESPQLQDSRRRQFLNRQAQKQQRLQYRFKQIKRQEIHRAKCSKCDISQIVGARYQCPFCLSFNLCQACQRQDDHMHSLVKVKKANRAINYEELRNHLNLQFPDQDLINKQKQLQELRKSYRQLEKLLMETKRKEQVNKKDTFYDKIKSERQNFKSNFEQKWRQSKRQSDRKGKQIDQKFGKQSTRSRQKYNYEDYRSYYHSQEIPLEAQIQHRRRLLYPYSDIYRY